MSNEKKQTQAKSKAKPKNMQDELLETLETVKEFAEDKREESMTYDEFEALVYEGSDDPFDVGCVDALELFQELDDNFDSRDPLSVESTRRITEKHLDEFLSCKEVDAETLAAMLAPRVVFRNLSRFKELKGYDIDINWLAKRLDKKFVRAHFTGLMNRGADPMLLVKKLFYRREHGSMVYIGDNDDQEILQKNFKKLVNEKNADELAGLAYGNICDDDLILELSKLGVSAYKIYDLTRFEWSNVEETKTTLMVLKRIGLSSEEILDALISSEYRTDYAEAVMKNPDLWEKDLGINRKDFVEIYVNSEIDAYSVEVRKILSILANAGCVDELIAVMPRDDFMQNVLEDYNYDIQAFLEEYKSLGGNLDLLEEKLLLNFDYDCLDQAEFAIEFIRAGRGILVNKRILLESIKTKWADYFTEELPEIVALLEG